MKWHLFSQWLWMWNSWILSSDMAISLILNVVATMSEYSLTCCLHTCKDCSVISPSEAKLYRGSVYVADFYPDLFSPWKETQGLIILLKEYIKDWCFSSFLPLHTENSKQNKLIAYKNSADNPLIFFTATLALMWNSLEISEWSSLCEISVGPILLENTAQAYEVLTTVAHI